MESTKQKSFNGTGNVRQVLTGAELRSSLKSYTGLKAAQHIASKLEGSALYVYLRLPKDDKKDVAKVQKELLAEFEKGQLNREEAIQELAKRSRAKGESAQTFACKIFELVKFAYSSIEDHTRDTIAMDYFVRGLHAGTQIALKSNEKFSSTAIKALAMDITRLEIAGIKSSGGARGFISQVTCVDDRSLLVDEIAKKVPEKLRGASLDPFMHLGDGGNTIINDVNLSNTNSGNRGHFNNNRGNFSNQGRRGDNRQTSRNRSSQQQQSRNNRSAEPVTVPTTSCVIALQGFARPVAHGAMMPGTALVRTMINDYMKVRNILKFCLRIKKNQL